MRQFWAVTRVNVLMALYNLSLIRRRTGRREGRGVLYGVAAVVVFLTGYWGFVSWQLSQQLRPLGYEWVVLTVAMLVMPTMVLALGFYSFNSLLFESADTDQLFAYPLSKLTVIAGKISGLIVQNWLVTFVFWAPAVAVYAYVTHPGPLFYPFALITWLIIPGIPLFVLGLISYIVGLLASGPRLRRLLSVGLTLALLVGVGFGIKAAVVRLTATADLSGDLFSLLQHFYPPVGYATRALAQGSWSALGLAVVWNAGPFLVVAVLIAGSYSWIRSRMTTVERVTSGRVTYTSTTAARALFGKEWGRLLGSPMYLLNSLIGGALLILFAFLMGRTTGSNAVNLRQILTDAGLSMTVVVLLFDLFFLAITNTTAPSISLEGKNLWIIQSLPVGAATILRAKWLVQACAVVPVILVAGGITVFTVGIGWGGFAAVVVPCVLFTLTGAGVGLIFNLHFYRFDFYNDQQVVKNSASVILTMGTMVVVVCVAVFGYWLAGRLVSVNFWTYWTVWVVILAAAAVAAYRFVMTRGAVLFAQIG